MTITLPDDMREELERKAKAAGFATVDEYVADMLAEELLIDKLMANLPPSRLTPRDRADLERMLEEGMNSGPPIRATPEFWEERRRKLEERIAERAPEPLVVDTTRAEAPFTPPSS